MKGVLLTAGLRTGLLRTGLLSTGLLWTGLLLSGCTRYVEVAPEGGPAAYYRTAFPVTDVSGDLERILRSVVRIQVGGFYRTYHFSRETAASEAELRGSGRELLARAVDTVSSSSSRAATAVVIGSAGGSGRLTLLTTDHVIHFPDTIVEYYRDDGTTLTSVTGERVLERVSIKSGQTNTISTPSMVEPFRILARDPSADLALIGAAPMDGTAPVEAPPLELAGGDPRRLSWGSFVYVLGHPAGFRMVTRGIVSEPERGPDGSFLIDGLWNEGMSGAPILAVRGVGGGLEWVGIARAAAARTEIRLVPEEGAEREQDANRPYAGPVYLEQTQAIRYGITFSVPVPQIRDFVDAHRASLEESSFPVPSF